MRKFKYSTAEKIAVVTLFEEVKGIYTRKNKRKSNYAISKRVKYMLNKIKGYAEINTKNIQNWYKNKTKVLKKKV